MRVVALMVMVMWMGVAHGDEPAARALARERFESGSAAFRRGDYETACRDFANSYELAPAPQLLYNIGLCAEKRGKLREALDAYQRYIAVAPDEEIEAHMVVLRQMLRDAPAPPPVAPPPVQPTPIAVRTVVVEPVHRTPIYKRAALWAPIGVLAAAGLAVGLGVGLTRPHDTRFPTLDAR